MTDTTSEHSPNDILNAVSFIIKVKRNKNINIKTDRQPDVKKTKDCIINESSIKEVEEEEKEDLKLYIPKITPCIQQEKKINNSKTKKNGCSVKKLWKLFDTEIQSQSSPSQSSMECVYQDQYTDEPHNCDACGFRLMITENGFPTCTNMKCGIIYKTALDYSPEWRFYGAEDKNTSDPARCGNPMNPLLMETYFGCKIICDGKSSYEMRKIRKWTEWVSVPHKEKSLYEEFQFINIMAQNAGIPKIFIDYAMIIHKDISEQKLFRGLNRDGIKAASIYISCRLNGCPRTAFEIAEIFNLDKQSATNGCSNAVNILQNIERNVDISQKSVLTAALPSSFIERFSSKIGLPYELVVLSKFISKTVESNNLICDNTPQSIAAGIIFLISVVCSLNIPKSEIRIVCGVSEVTINKCFKKLDSIKYDIIPKCIIEKYSSYHIT